MGKADVIAHNVRFYNPEPRAIHCMALERKKYKLALSRPVKFYFIKYFLKTELFKFSEFIIVKCS